MKSTVPSRRVIVGVAVMLLTACGGAQPPIGAPGVVPQSRAFFAPTSANHNVAVANGSYGVLYSFAFAGPNGSEPAAGLIDVNGALYGTTTSGGGGCRGGGGCGTVYSITTTGVEKVLHSFSHHPKHTYTGYPLAALTNAKGTLYGTTDGGGTLFGTVFSVNTAGRFKLLHVFSNAGGYRNGFYPEASLINVKGTLYGTTYFGGSLKRHREGFGTVYTISTTGTEKYLYRFKGGSDGASPQAGLIDIDGTLYGTTVQGGGSGCSGYGCGTVYSISTSGVEKVLHRFTDHPDGANPQGGLINVNGTLYGTTSGGGSYYGGTIYSINTTGKEKVLYSFRGGADGAQPEAGLIDVNGTLYGTTFSGGGCVSASSSGCGTVFSVSATGSEKVLHQFTGNADGANPQAGLLNVKDRLYGTTLLGGVGGGGTVFTVSP